ncbi:IS3 family transposase [Paucibacter sp. KCTC 42545]|uniref:IS3 family transposase n=1 Tax=Paucibacter sp. KCTC 42545 TaxID=1768242 RepID=UPI001E2CF431|nr:IS3 family transposase [Paucibacter sp. KCTC 42545]
MKKSRFTEEQIIGFLKQAEAGMPIKELCRQGGFSDATFYKWRAKYGGMQATDAKRLRELEGENAKLKRLLAEAHLDIHALKDVFGVKPLAPQVRRDAATQMIAQHHLSERRACRLVGLSRDSYRNPPVVDEATQQLSAKIVEIAQVRRRFGYRRIHDVLRPQFPGVNHKRVYRLYSQAQLAVRKRKKIRRAASERVPLTVPTRVNEVWSMDFVSDSLANGRRIKCLTVADDFTHECVDIAVDYGISGQYVTRLLDRAAIFRGYPAAVRTDNGPEFTCRAHGDGSFGRRLAQLARIDLLVIDDFAIAPVTAADRNDLLELLDDRVGSRSTLITSQLPVSNWHQWLDDPTLADAILDRIVHSAQKIALKGESLRKKQDSV